MNRVPEGDLKRILHDVASASRRDDAARRTAARWFNRLYYDVRKWNEGFISFLRTYPGFGGSRAKGKFETFLRQLNEYRESLEERYGTVKGDLCTSLKVLSARYPKDFGWLYKQDENLYHQIRRLIDNTYASESNVIEVAHGVCQFIWSVNQDPNWHKENYQQVVDRIAQYEQESKREVADIKRMADDVGIHLLDIAEYEAILNNEGSSNPEVMVVGEITMSQDNIHIHDVVGPVNVKARLDHVKQVVTNAPAVPKKEKEELTALLGQLEEALASVAKQQPEDAQRVLQAAEMVSAEVAKQKPSKSFLNITAEGLKEAAKAVAAIAPTVLDVATKIATSVSKLF